VAGANDFSAIQNMFELVTSGVKLAYSTGYNFIFEIGEVNALSKFQRNAVNCLSYEE